MFYFYFNETYFVVHCSVVETPEVCVFTVMPCSCSKCCTKSDILTFVSSALFCNLKVSFHSSL